MSYTMKQSILTLRDPRYEYVRIRSACTRITQVQTSPCRYLLHTLAQSRSARDVIDREEDLLITCLLFVDH